MANRHTRIYTRTGDKGETGTADGSRVAKDDLLIHVQGDIDELSSLIGLLATKIDDVYHEEVRNIQHDLFDIGAELSLGQALIKTGKVESLEHQIDRYNQDLQPLKEFILPGGNEEGSLCHLARTVCRRVERNMVTLNRQRKINPITLSYINRLSDFLFVFARVLNDRNEIFWQPNKNNHEA